MRHTFTIALWLALGLSLAFLMVPVVAVFLQVPPGELVDHVRGPVVRDAVIVSLRSNVIADVIIVVVGTPAAYLLASHRAFPGRRVLVTLLELPLVLPPAVAGIGLLAAFGRSGLLGGELSTLGIHVPFTELAVVLAIVFVAGPFYLRQAIASFEAVDPRMVAAARTLGAGPGRAFARIVLPLAGGGLAAGWALAFARGMGEFGATLIFAGSLPGVTQTLPLAVYAQLGQDFGTALAIGALLVVISAAILLAVKAVPVWDPTSSSTPVSRHR